MKNALIEKQVKPNYIKLSLSLSSANVHLLLILITGTLTEHRVDPLKISSELPHVPCLDMFGVCLGFYLLTFLLMLIMTEVVRECKQNTH